MRRIGKIRRSYSSFINALGVKHRVGLPSLSAHPMYENARFLLFAK